MSEKGEEKISLSPTDVLALERTKLANERTALAYLRTFIGMAASGAALLKLFDVPWAHTAATFLLLGAPILLVLGLCRSIRMNHHLKSHDFMKSISRTRETP